MSFVSRKRSYYLFLFPFVPIGISNIPIFDDPEPIVEKVMSKVE